MLDKLIKEAENDEELIAFLKVFIPLYEENATVSAESKIENSTENTKLEEIRKIQVHQIIKEGIEKHVNELCVGACEELWNKNIYTKNIKVDDEKIEITLEKLSDENEALFQKRAKKNPDKYGKNKDENYTIKVEKKGRKTGTIKSELKNTVKYFFIQDVETGFLDKKNFLMNVCDCEKVEGMKENAEKLNLKIVFDEAKMEKTFEEYLKEKNYEHLYLKDEDRIYLDEYYLDAHKNYLKSKEE